MGNVGWVLKVLHSDFLLSCEAIPQLRCVWAIGNSQMAPFTGELSEVANN